MGHVAVITQVKALPDAIKKELRQTIMELRNQLKAKAKSQAPYDTGKLERSVRGSFRYYRTYPQGMVARVYSREYYARFHEWGTKKMVGHSFLRSALADMEPIIKMHLEAVLDKAVDGVMR